MEIKKLFNCAQVLLYIIAEMGWDYCLEFNRKFGEYKGKYTPQYVADAQQAIRDAKDIASITKRNEQITIARKELLDSAAVVRKSFKSLKGYITSAYKMAANRDAKYKAAGCDYYPDSINNWESLKNLLDRSLAFIKDNETALKANNNMPDEFIKKYLDECGTCAAVYKAYANSDVEKPIVTKTKTEADNDIYLALMDMFADGQIIFSAEKGLVRKFSFSVLHKIVKSKSPASLSGFMYYMPNKGLEGVTISTENGEYSTTTDKRGRYELLQVKSGTYTFVFSKPGYKTMHETMTLKPDTSKHFKTVLEKVLMQLEIAA